MLVGFHVEGTDVLILRCLLARLLGIDEDDIEADVLEARSGGCSDLVRTVPMALARFYNKCASAVIVGMDNDGNVDLVAASAKEDPKHPRHWNHGSPVEEKCRYCRLFGEVERCRPNLNYLPNKPGHSWPIVITVPTETIEAWLLAIRAAEPQGRTEELSAESLPRSKLKQMFYRKPLISRQDVEAAALPLVRRLDANSIDRVEQHSRSFSDFARQVKAHQSRILEQSDCWASD